MRFDDHPDWDEIDRRRFELARLVFSSPREGLAALIQFADELPDERLCQVGVDVVETLRDLHWDEIGEAFEREALEHNSLRKALSCAWLSIDADAERRLRLLIRPEEEIGRQRTSDEPRPTWVRVEGAPIRVVRLGELLSMIEEAAAAGMSNSVDPTRLVEVADPGAGHLVWPRFRCDPLGDVPPFYRCAAHLHLAQQAVADAVCEVDLLVPSIDTLPELSARRATGLLKSALAKRPGVNEV